MEKGDYIQEIDESWSRGLEDATVYEEKPYEPKEQMPRIVPLTMSMVDYATKFNWKETRKRYGVWGIILLSVLFFYLFLLGISTSEVSRELNKASYHSVLGPVLDELTDDTKAMRVEVRISSVNFGKEQIDAWVYFFPSRNISAPSGQMLFPISYNLKYSYGVVKEGAILSPFETVVPIISGSDYYYPFDKFKAELMIEIMDTRTHTPLPIEIDILVNTPSLWFDISRIENDPLLDDEDTDEDTLFRVILNINRPVFAIIFCVFIVMLMWLLSLAIFGMAIAVSVFSTSRPNGAYLGLGLACLFALPNLRSTQPEVPPLGALIDVIGFFW
ncbi:hypothetical protein DSO57_1019016 [Entomophthora muscae]|uniref:Uncharacterized protein n=1 Tax=Entomophthora muscae TaxID=34485 RepID=A0ACC2RV80_9FUNG|nr:hypothetical protein DSO57_1019016 [Entomophthora muscae]